MQVGKLLYVTDFRQPSFSEVERLMDLRSLGLEEVVFLHASKAEGWERRLADYGIDSKTFVERPRVARILDTARREAVSLIAASLNTHRRRRLRGSLTTDLLRASSLPVLILHEGAQASGSGEGGLFTHPVFATDWSGASEKAMNYLLKFKEDIKELEIIHVIDKKLSVGDIRNLKKKVTESRKIFLNQGIDAEGHIYAGKQSDEVMLAARDYDATCIVMGKTGKSAVRDLFSPSCSYRVAEESVVPTLVVP